MKPDQTLADRVAELRSAYRLTIEEFARLSNLSTGAVNNYENSKTLKPNDTSLGQIVKSFGTTYDWLRYGKGPMLPNGMLRADKPEPIYENETETYQALKLRNAHLETEMQRLWRLLEAVITRPEHKN